MGEETIVKKRSRGPRKAEDLRHTEIVAVRFTKVERQMLELYVRRENMKLTAFVRSCAILYAKSSLDDEAIFSDVKPGEMGLAKSTVFGMIEDFKLAMSKTMSSMDERLFSNDAKLTALAWYVLFYARPWSEEEAGIAMGNHEKRWNMFQEKIKFFMRKGSAS